MTAILMTETKNGSMLLGHPREKCCDMREGGDRVGIVWFLKKPQHKSWEGSI